MSFAFVIVLVCVAVLYGFHRAGELRWPQVVVAALGGFLAASSRIGPHLGDVMAGVYWWVGSWHL